MGEGVQLQKIVITIKNLAASERLRPILVWLLLDGGQPDVTGEASPFLDRGREFRAGNSRRFLGLIYPFEGDISPGKLICN